MRSFVTILFITTTLLACSHTKTEPSDELSKVNNSNTYSQDFWSQSDRYSLGYFLASLASSEETQKIGAGYKDIRQYSENDCRNHINTFIKVSQKEGFEVVTSPANTYILIRAIQTNIKRSTMIRHFAVWDATDKRFDSLPKKFITGRCSLFGRNMDAAIF